MTRIVELRNRTASQRLDARWLVARGGRRRSDRLRPVPPGLCAEAGRPRLLLSCAKTSTARWCLTTYGRSTGFCIDPIEKKPLNHFYPGHQRAVVRHGRLQPGLQVLPELGHLQVARGRRGSASRPTPETIAEAAAQLGCRSVAFTYNDPVIWAEYAIDTARACRERGVQDGGRDGRLHHAGSAGRLLRRDGRRQRRPEGVHRGVLSTS